MSCELDSTLLNWMFLATASTAVTVIPCGAWQPTGNKNVARGWGEMQGRTGLIQVVIGIQYANDVRAPAGTFPVSAVMAANGVSDPLPAGFTTVGLGPYKYWRPVWLISLTTGATLGSAAVAGVVESGRS